MNDSLSISYSDLASDVTKMKETIKSMNSLIDNAKKISSHTTSYWLGDGASNYRTKLDKALKEWEELYTEMQASITYLDNIVKNYQTLDSQIMGL